MKWLVYFFILFLFEKNTFSEWFLENSNFREYYKIYIVNIVNLFNWNKEEYKFLNLIA